MHPGHPDAHEVAGERGAVLFAAAAVLGAVATGFLLSDAIRSSSRRLAAGVAVLASLGGTAALVLGAILSVVWVCVEF